ncbi:MAG: hypothetical protein ABL861_10465 [Nitrosomonas sp.]
MIRYISQKQLPLEGFDTPPGMILDSNISSSQATHWDVRQSVSLKIKMN